MRGEVGMSEQKRGLVVNGNEKVRVKLRATGKVVETSLWDLFADYGVAFRTGWLSPFEGGDIEFMEREPEDEARRKQERAYAESRVVLPPWTGHTTFDERDVRRMAADLERLRQALEQIASLPGSRCDEAPSMARAAMEPVGLAGQKGEPLIPGGAIPARNSGDHDTTP
jgi:hypothetical protein